ncbi:MAG: TIGR02270 family protein, partial [Lysobacterales bacterium]
RRRTPRPVGLSGSAVQVLEDIIEEHAEEAAFLWGQRDAAVRAPDYDLEEIAELDERVEAHLDGLRIAGEAGWSACKEIGWDMPGEYFAGMSLAIATHRDDLADEVLDAAEGDDAGTRGVISAFGWAAPAELQGIVKRLLTEASPYRRRIAIGACAVHRVDPGDHLLRALADPDDGLRARALKAAGELGRSDCLPQLEQNLEAAGDEVRFWACWSAARFGSLAALKILGLFVTSDNPRRRQAMNLALRAMEAASSQQWVRTLAQDTAQRRYALIAAGIQGDPLFLPALVSLFPDEAHARVAGEAFEMITGLNMFRESFEVIPQQPPPTQEQEPQEQSADELLAETEEDEEYADLGEDLGLVLPDPAKMDPWFARNRERFVSGRRHLCGEPITPENCLAILRQGQQRQRIAAALERALVEPAKAMFEWRAPGRRQLETLRKMG